MTQVTSPAVIDQTEVAGPVSLEPTLTLSIFPDVGAKRVRALSETWERLVQRIRQPKQYPNKPTCPLIKLARFGDQRTEKGSLRHDANIVEVTGVEGDYDAGKVSITQATMMLASAGISAVFYTSPSHTEQVPRWRVLAPLSHAYPPGDRARFLARVNGALGGILAPESFTLSQAYYIGRVEGVQYEVQQVRGCCADLLPDLDQIAISPASKGESRVERLTHIHSGDPVIHRLTERGLVKRHRSDGGIDITCSFEGSHTGSGGPGDTTYFPPHTGGYARGHFKCLHSHCAERADDEFLQAIGLPTEAADGSKYQRRQKTLAPQAANDTFSPADARRSAEVVCLADVAPEPVSWLWDQRIALGKVALIAGDPDLGKSLVTLSIAAAVTTGARWPVSGGNAPMGEVILLSAEDNIADTIRPRTDAAGGDVNKIHVIGMIRDIDPQTGALTRRSFSLRRDIVVLGEVLAAHRDCKLVVIDPISAYLDGTDSNANAAVRGLLTPLAELAAKFKVAVVAVSHLNKGGGQTSAMYRITASLGFVAAARAVYAVIKDKDDEARRLVLLVKNNLSPDRTGLAYRIARARNGAPRIEWEAEPVTISADEAMARPEESHEHSKRANAQVFLREVLSDGPVSSVQIRAEAAAAGYAWRTIERAQEDIGIKPRKLGKEEGWAWALPSKTAKNSEDRHLETMAAFEQVGGLREPGADETEGSSGDVNYEVVE